MINIEIKPAYRNEPGYIKAQGHASGAPAGQNLVCCAVTTLIAALQTNLQDCRDIYVYGHANSGDVDLRWNKCDRHGKGLARARIYTDFVYQGLRGLQRNYPKDIRIRWTEPEREKGEGYDHPRGAGRRP